MNKSDKKISKQEARNQRNQKNQTIVLNVAFNKMLFAHVQVVCDINKAMSLCRKFGDYIVSLYRLRVHDQTIKIANNTTVTAEYTVGITEQSLEPLLRAMVPSTAMVQTVLFTQAGSRIKDPDKEAQKHKKESNLTRKRRADDFAPDFVAMSARNHSKNKIKKSVEVTDEMVDKILKPRKFGTRLSTPHVQRKMPVRSDNTTKCMWLELIRRGASVGSLAVYFNVSPATITSAMRGYRWPEAEKYQKEIREAIRVQAQLGSSETYTEEQIIGIREHLNVMNVFDGTKWNKAFASQRYNTSEANAILRGIAD